MAYSRVGSLLHHVRYAATANFMLYFHPQQKIPETLALSFLTESNINTAASLTYFRYRNPLGLNYFNNLSVTSGDFIDQFKQQVVNRPDIEDSPDKQKQLPWLWRRKIKEKFFCKNCGSQHCKWAGVCQKCAEHNTIVKELVQVRKLPTKNKVKVEFVCKNCGFKLCKWAGKCPQCQEPNTLAKVHVHRGKKIKVRKRFVCKNCGCMLFQWSQKCLYCKEVNCVVTREVVEVGVSRNRSYMKTNQNIPQSFNETASDAK